MTIPTRKEALEAVNNVMAVARDMGWKVDQDEDFATLRSYIESHTGEVVGWTSPSELSDMQSGITARMWKETARGRGIPLFASPVQPVKLEWAGHDLMLNNIRVGWIIIDAGLFYACFMSRSILIAPCFSNENDAKLNVESVARQWLSGGDK